MITSGGIEGTTEDTTRSGSATEATTRSGTEATSKGATAGATHDLRTHRSRRPVAALMRRAHHEMDRAASLADGDALIGTHARAALDVLGVLRWSLDYRTAPERARIIARSAA